MTKIFPDYFIVINLAGINFRGKNPAKISPSNILGSTKSEKINPCEIFPETNSRIDYWNWIESMFFGAYS